MYNSIRKSSATKRHMSNPRFSKKRTVLIVMVVCIIASIVVIASSGLMGSDQKSPHLSTDPGPLS